MGIEDCDEQKQLETRSHFAGPSLNATKKMFRLFTISLSFVFLGCAAQTSKSHLRSQSKADSSKSSTHISEPQNSAILHSDTSSEFSERQLPEKRSDDEATAVGVHGAVSSAEANASRIGIQILKRGGNAADAAIAVAFALSVTHPSAGNIGGGGFMLLRLPDGKSTSIDYREVAPLASSRDMYLDEKGKLTQDSRHGARAAGIPGDVAGFGYLHEKFATLPWSELIAPAIALAEDGWALDSFHAEDLKRAASRMRKNGYPTSASNFLDRRGQPFAAGAVWRQPDLANSLSWIAENGWSSFYDGPLAKKLVSEVQRLGGIWTETDLKEYRPVEREPIEFDYRGHKIIAMPPPSAGGIVLRQVLAANEILGTNRLPWLSVDRVHLYAEVLRRTYADRNMMLGDPDFIQVPLDKLLSLEYIRHRISDIDPKRATPSSEVGKGKPGYESTETTHFSIVDRDGFAIANTFTLNGGFGAKVVVPGTGVILNNEMDDFAVQPGKANMYGLVQGEQNAIAPRKRMLSSMTPTIVTKDGRLRAIVGSPGGPTITTTVAQIIMQLIDHGQTISDAVASPRIHHQWLPDRIIHESKLDSKLLDELVARGHALYEWKYIGHANCIEVDPKTKGFRAVADIVRDGGSAVAY